MRRLLLEPWRRWWELPELEPPEPRLLEPLLLDPESLDAERLEPECERELPEALDRPELE
ncbi:hypothetical protein GCM10009717_31140 [Agromyces allii]|uniref:Uncharacterized protein n=1 Tax=Agromyces allii TaxID=393607 RepID=A0ABN2R203_9MICO